MVALPGPKQKTSSLVDDIVDSFLQDHSYFVEACWPRACLLSFACSHKLSLLAVHLAGAIVAAAVGQAGSYEMWVFHVS